ncbi:MAG: hypothetical protein ABSA05_12745 [Opitutaceae bacterium]
MKRLAQVLGFFVCLAAFLLVFGASPARAQSYAVSNLGPFEPAAIDNAGTVVGYTVKTTSVNVPLGTDETFTYRAVSNSGEIMTDLGSLGGTYSESGASEGRNSEFFVYYGQAAAINNSGTIVGLAGTSAGTEHAFSYSNGKMTDLGTLPGRTASQANGINNAGTIVGSSSSEESTHAFSYGDGIMTDLGTLYPADIVSQANAINDAGTIVGNSGQRAFSYSNGIMTDLGTLYPGDLICQAYAINNAGTIVGDSDGRAFSFANGAFTDLGYLDKSEPESTAYAINNSGTIVGLSYVQTGGPQYFLDSQHAFVYRNGMMTDLNSLVSLPGVTLSIASGINDHGQIVCSGDDDNSYLLTPISSVVGNVSVAISASSQPVPAGTPVRLSLNTASGYTYQWFLNGTAIAGATSGMYTPGQVGSSSTGVVGTADSGLYTVLVTDAQGNQGALNLGTLTVAENAWLMNTSARAFAGTGDDVLIAGVVLDIAQGSMNLMVRADGPSLAAPPFNLAGVLAQPEMQLYNGPTDLLATSGWNPATTTLGSDVPVPDVASFFAAIWAETYGWAPGSADGAFLYNFSQSGGYTTVVSGQSGGTGIACVELYDADAASNALLGSTLPGPPTNRIVNLSARGFVGTGSRALIGGFVFSGTTPKTFLIRGGGPFLSSLGVTDAVASTSITLFDSGLNGASPKPIATNTGWGNAISVGTSSLVTGPAPIVGLEAATQGIFSAVGASGNWVSGGGDSAMVVTLPPGAYTVVESGVAGATGVGLVEIYDMD